MSNIISNGVQPEGNSSQRARIFISYKRDVEPDEPVALKVFNALSAQFDIFIDKKMPSGEKWAKRIEKELRRSDFLISILSAASVHSEMVLEEIDMAHKLSKESGGPPVILPVRLAYREPFEYPLSAYLNPINWAYCHGLEDAPRLIQELIIAITGGDLPVREEKDKEELVQSDAPAPMPYPLASAQPLSLDTPGGAISPESGLYVERPGDSVALEEIEKNGVTITITGPRQIGKSSLLIRTIEAAGKSGKRAVHLDFQLMGACVLENGEQFFREFCMWLSEELELENRVDRFWPSIKSNGRLCTLYMADILKQLETPLLLAMDEVDILFNRDYRTDFFGMLRSWHNSRALNQKWKNLNLALVTSTEPYQLIEDPNMSPFNVGQVIDLPDFTLTQVAYLNKHHASPLNSAEINNLFELIGGQPYLVRKALYLVAQKRYKFPDLLKRATDEQGPFGDHLRHHMFRMIKEEELIEGMRDIIKAKSCKELVFNRLRGAGLVSKVGKEIVPRCKLYADYFGERLNGK